MAMYFLQQEIGSILRTSSVYITAPWGNDNQPKYLNQALIINTPHTPLQLLKKLQKIEKKLGRTNKNQYASRTIDIDILFYDNLIISNENLTIPHPHICKRMFTLMPLTEIAPNYVHPVLNKSIYSIFKECEDKAFVKIYKEENDI